MYCCADSFNRFTVKGTMAITNNPPMIMSQTAVLNLGNLLKTPGLDAGDVSEIFAISY
jgi:hypothetical protein